MTLLLSMLPIYVFGNLHCLGMCGPLAMMISQSPYRFFYLLGRLVSFTLAGSIAGGFGYVLGAALQTVHLSGALSIGMGLIMMFLGLAILSGSHAPSELFSRGYFTDYLNRLLLKKDPGALFLFGFLTIALPCGQTLLVYTACALSGSVWIGTLNGLVFAFLTTPALFLAMQARHFVGLVKKWYEPVVAGSALLIGGIAILRGLAEWGAIPHLGYKHLIIY